MKKLLLLLLCFAFLFSGCAKTAPPVEADTESEEETDVLDAKDEAPVDTETPPEEPEQEAPVSDKGSPGPLTRMRMQMNGNYSFNLSMNYTNLLVNGISQDVVQEYAENGDFHFTTTARQWDHGTETDITTKGEYYYRYENGELVCYSKINDGETERRELTFDDFQEIKDTERDSISVNAIFPSYIESLTDEGIDEETGCALYTFTLPVGKVLSDQTMLSNLVTYAYYLSGNLYDPTIPINIGCTVYADADSLRPLKVVYDFTELKPYVLSDGALSGEFALDSDLMSMTYMFYYDLLAKLEIPSEFLP